MPFCCQTEEPQFKYQVKQINQNGNGSNRSTYKYFNSLEDVDNLVKQNENVSIIKVKTQIGLNDIKNQLKNENKQFTDQTFPPNHSSLGAILGSVSWKRIPQLIKNQRPVLFDNKIEPSDVITGHEGDCYLLSSLAALAQYPDIIKNIFRGQAFNPQGIYKVNLRVDGVVEEVVIDDYIPVQQNGLPVFCQPNKKTGQFWVVLLEKALAKINGSYANLNEGIPSQIFRAITYAPSESLVFSQQSQQEQKIWNLLKEYTKNHYPFCATSKASAVQELGLEHSHTYTIIAAQDLEIDDKKLRLVKLRNPWKIVNYKGAGNAEDHQFWSNIKETQQKNSIQSANNNCDDGLFYMQFQDFCHNFNQIHYCNLNSGGKFLSEQLLLGNKASFYDVTIQRKGTVTFEINQSKTVGLTEQQQQSQGISRSTLLLIKKQRNQHGYRYQFINGTMKYNELNTILTQQLGPGDYIVYVKVDPIFKSHKFPHNVTINLYSKNFANLQAVLRTKYPTLIRDAFLDHALHNKRSEYSDGKVWVSWQLLFQKGGFAYLAAGNSKDSQQNIIISFSEEQFKNLNFKLKKPLKGLGNLQTLRIPPGQTNIIVARIINDPSIKSVKFPPKLDIKLQPLHQ